MRRLPTLSLIAVTVGSLWLMAADVPPGSRTAVTTPVSGLNAAGRSIPVRVSDAGGISVELVDSTGASTGTAAAPLRTDPTGTTQQPIVIQLPDSGLFGVSGAPVRTDPTGTTTQPTHEKGFTPTVNSSACVLCSTYGDGGVLAVTPGQLYAAKAADLNGSPLTYAEKTACGSFAGTGSTMQAGGTEYYVGGAAFSDGGLPYLTCCAQAATSTAPTGPWLCVTPIQ